MESVNIIVPGHNRQLAVIFRQMANCYRYLGKEERFRAVAYNHVAQILDNMKEDISSYATDIKSLDALQGIGESIAEKIIEYLHTGKIAAFDKLKTMVPYDLLTLLDITGIGPATLKVLHEQLGIANSEDLIRALEAQAPATLKGLSRTQVENIRRALKLYKDKKRLPYNEALTIADDFLQAIKNIPGVQQVSLAGSLRRKAETIGDIDMVLVVLPEHRRYVVQKLITLPQIDSVLMKGTTKVSVILKQKSFQADLRLVNDNEYGAAMLYSTGSMEHTIHLRTIARQKGYKMNEYGIFNTGNHQALAGKTEEGMYHCLGLGFIPPEIRSDSGEIEKARLKYQVY